MKIRDSQNFLSLYYEPNAVETAIGETNPHLAPLVTLFLNSSWGRDSFAQVNRFYGDGLNKLEPKDVESLPCPKLPHCNRDQAETIVKQLAQLELLPLDQRSKQVDVLISTYIHLPARATA